MIRLSLLSKKQKIIDKFKSNPKDLTWDELTSMLNHLGYQEQKTGKTGGSRRRYLHENPDLPPISLHEPHPSKIIKSYVIRELRNMLEKENLI